MMDLYKLEGHEPVLVADVLEWGRWLQSAVERGETVVARDELDGIIVSTVFLGLDHGFPTRRVLLFETMVFEGVAFTPLFSSPWFLRVRSSWDLQPRYSTWDEAVAGHRAVLARVRAVLAARQRKGADAAEPDTRGESGAT